MKGAIENIVEIVYCIEYKMSYSQPVQYSGSIYMNTVNTITEYNPPTSEMEQRPDVTFVSPPFSKPSVPKILFPEMDRIPQDEVERKDTLSDAERQTAFLDNSLKTHGYLQMHQSDTSSSHLDNQASNISPIFFGTLSMVGLFLVYRAMQNYT